MPVWSLDQEDPLEKEMATHSSVLAWGISWTEESGGHNLWGHKRVRHNLVTKKQQTPTCLQKWKPTQGIIIESGNLQRKYSNKIKIQK